MKCLRELDRKDLPIINKWRNDEELIELLGAPFRYINIEVDEQWFDNYMSNRSSTVRCAIVDSKDVIIGLISLTSINSINQSAQLHIMIGDCENQGKGIGTIAIKGMVEHAFNNLNLHRIELLVLESNKRAQRVYEKVGFKREGIKRKAVYKSSRFIDLYLYAILREDYDISND